MGNLGVQGSQRVVINTTAAPGRQMLNSQGNVGAAYAVDANATKTDVFKNEVSINGQKAFVSDEGLKLLEKFAKEDDSIMNGGGSRTSVSADEDTGVTSFSGAVKLSEDPGFGRKSMSDWIDGITNLEDES